jgi:hypothetical protein
MLKFLVIGGALAMIASPAAAQLVARQPSVPGVVKEDVRPLINRQLLLVPRQPGGPQCLSCPPDTRNLNQQQIRR